MKNKAVSTEEVRRWWEENPFTLGVATNDYAKNDLVGRKDFREMDSDYFREVDRKFRKHQGVKAQEPGKPLLSGLIDYESRIRGKRVLDIAVGTGLHSAAFAEAGAEVTGIDLTEYAVLQARRNLELRGLKVDFVQMDAQHLAFPDDSFDFVNAWGCLMHMPDTEGAVREIGRVLKPGGAVLAYMYNRDSWPFWFNIILLRGILLGGLLRYKGDIVRMTSRYSDGSHKKGNMLTKFFSKSRVKRMFEEAGFGHVEVFPFEIAHEPDSWPMRSFPVFKFLPSPVKSWMAKRWGYGLIVKAVK